MSKELCVAYEIIMSEMTNEDGVSYYTYGIRAICYKNNPCTVDCTMVGKDEIVDVSNNMDFVAKLVDVLNKLNVSIEHFRDVVFDSIYKEYCVT